MGDNEDSISPPQRNLFYCLSDIEGVEQEYEVGEPHWRRKYRIDIAFPKQKLAVEVDGYRHKLASQRESDERKDDYLRERGWRIFRIPARYCYDQAGSVAGQVLVYLEHPEMDPEDDVDQWPWESEEDYDG